MYSYEDRLRAVRLYIKLGKRIGLTIRQLGYPTKNALLSWHREYEQRLDLPAGYVRQPRYSQAHKERAVGHYLDHGRCIAVTIKALGYPSRSLLSAWLQELYPQERTRVVSQFQEPAVVKAVVAWVEDQAACRLEGLVSLIGLSGLRWTTSMRVQFRVVPDHRLGCRMRAAAYTATRLLNRDRSICE